jgi:hypothetical protein
MGALTFEAGSVISGARRARDSPTTGLFCRYTLGVAMCTSMSIYADAPTRNDD